MVPYGILRIETQMATCKASALPDTLLLRPLDGWIIPRKLQIRSEGILCSRILTDAPRQIYPRKQVEQNLLVSTH